MLLGRDIPAAWYTPTAVIRLKISKVISLSNNSNVQQKTVYNKTLCIMYTVRVKFGIATSKLSCNHRLREQM